MKDILKTYCKVPRGFVKAKGRAEQTRCTHVKYEKVVRAAVRQLFDDPETIDMSGLPDLETGLDRSGT